MGRLSWNATKALVYQRANGCCEYCQTCEANIGQAMHIEHIDPKGSDEPENLCLACANCNLSKAKAISEIDPVSHQQVLLFNPRIQIWYEHFIWSVDGITVVGISAIGRATVERLKMNQARIVNARKRWVDSGYHPPRNFSSDPGC